MLEIRRQTETVYGIRTYMLQAYVRHAVAYSGGFSSSDDALQKSKGYEQKNAEANTGIYIVCIVFHDYPVYMAHNVVKNESLTKRVLSRK